jgi:hypothetical protein
MRKDLAQAHVLAKEDHNLEYYKQVLLEFQEQKIADAEARAARAKAKKDKSTSKKAEPEPEADEDVEMPDVEVPEGEESDTKKQKTKKRKAEDDSAVSFCLAQVMTWTNFYSIDASTLGLCEEAKDKVHDFFDPKGCRKWRAIA